MKIRWKNVIAWSIALSVTMGVIGFVYISYSFGQSPFTVALRMWRGTGERASWLDLEDSGTEYIRNPYASRLGKGHGYLLRATARVHLQKLDEARSDYAAAKKEEPEKFGSYSQCRFLAEAWAEMGHYYDAMKVFEALFPTYGNKYGFASFLARTKNDMYRDPKRAVLLAREVCAMQENGGTRYDRELLAITLASDGEFDEAIQEAENALNLPAANSASEDKDQERINVFIGRCKEKQFKFASHY